MTADRPYNGRLETLVFWYVAFAGSAAGAVLPFDRSNKERKNGLTFYFEWRLVPSSCCSVSSRFGTIRSREKDSR